MSRLILAIASGIGKLLGRIWAAPFFIMALAAAILAIGYIWPGARGNFWWEFRLWFPLALAILAFASQGGVSPRVVRALSIAVILFIGWHFWTERRWEAKTESGEVWAFKIDNGNIYPEQFDRFTFTAGEFVKVLVDGNYTVSGLIAPNGQRISGKQFLPGDFRFEKTNFHGEVRPFGEIQILSGDTPLQGINVSGDRTRLTILGTALTNGKLNIAFNEVPNMFLVSGTVRVKVDHVAASVVERQSKITTLLKKATDAAQDESYRIRLLGENTPSVDRIDLWDFNKRHPKEMKRKGGRVVQVKYLLNFGDVPNSVQTHQTPDGRYLYATGPAGWTIIAKPERIEEVVK